MVLPVVVIGSGFSGLSCAFHLAQAGLPVVILEKKEKLGGYFPELKRQFPTNSCGVCFMHPEYPAYCPYIEADRFENIVSYKNVTVENIERLDEKITISFSADGNKEVIEAQSLVFATGYEPFDISKKPELGGGLYKNVIPALVFENYLYDLMAEGKKLNDRKIAYIQCVGSRDLKIGSPYCSSFCCMYAMKQAMLIKEFDPDVDITIFFMDIRAFGKDYERYYREAINKGIKFIRSAVATVRKRPSTGKLEVVYAKDGSSTEETFDTVILSQGATFDEQTLSLLYKLNIRFDPYSSRPFENKEISKNIFVAGSLFEPMDIPDSVIDGISTASQIITRNAIVPKNYETPKIKIQKPSKIGIFALNLEETLVFKIRECFSETIKVSDINEIKFVIDETKLDGAIIICDDIRKTEGILKSNNYLGLHINSVALLPSYNNAVLDEVRATLLRMRNVQRTNYQYKKLNGKVCIVGGGLAGLVSAKFLAQMGLDIILVERNDKLGGRLLELPSKKEFMEKYITDVEKLEKVTILLNANIKEAKGRLGDFSILIETEKETRKEKVDAILITTGAKPRKNILSIEDNDRVFTSFDFEHRFEQILGANELVFIQCAGSRTDDNPVCYKVCCKKSIMNAIELKKNKPDMEIYILHKDIRTYGFNENLYREARSMGVQFIRYTKEPEVTKMNNKLIVKVFEEGTNSNFELKPDYLILSTGINPQTEEISKVLELETLDGFFVPYNKKTGILELKNGIYSAGLCLAPNYTDDVIKQSEAVALRIALKLARKELITMYNTAFVNPKYCCGCELCVKACPVSARYIDEDEKIARVDETLCEGCGTCAMVCANKASQHKTFEHKGMLKTIDLFVGL